MEADLAAAPEVHRAHPRAHGGHQRAGGAAAEAEVGEAELRAAGGAQHGACAVRVQALQAQFPRAAADQRAQPSLRNTAAQTFTFIEFI